jgi:hypothetical protein
VQYLREKNNFTMSILCRQVSLAEFTTHSRAHRRHWQIGIEVAFITYKEKTLGFIVPLEIFSSLPTESVVKMPLRDLQPWLFQNHQGWLEGIMDGLTLTWHRQEVLGFVHPRHQVQLPIGQFKSYRPRC